MPASILPTIPIRQGLPVRQIMNRPPIDFLPIFLSNNIYLVNYADKARWASGQLVDADNTTGNVALPWMGADNNSNGFVRLDNGVLMEDNKMYSALRTHPKWVNNGTIKGWLPWVQQKGTGTFKSQVGFLHGANGTDGVTFQVWIHYHVNGVEQWEPVIKQQKKYTGQLQEITADLSKWANQEISVEMRVDAGASSGQDWAAWINPRIEIAPVQVKTPGPVLAAGNPVFFNDRYDDNKKWYLPDFVLKQPAKDSFLFTCWKNVEPDASGKPTYNGNVVFRIDKNIPTAVSALITANTGITYTEIPLNNFEISFTLAFTTKQPIPYTGVITQAGNEYTLTLSPNAQFDPAVQETYLQNIFNFVSNPDYATYCTLSITGYYAGYTLKPAPPTLQIFQNTFRLNQLQAAKQVPAVHDNLHQVMMVHPFVNTQVAASTPAAAVVDSPGDTYNYNSAVYFSKTITGVNYPCSGTGGFPDNYVIKDPNSSSLLSFACHLPFGDGGARNYTYVEFTPTKTVLTDYGINNIYTNTFNYNHLIVPEKYLILLEKAAGANEEDPLIAAAYLNTVIDDTNDANCTATFRFHIAPDISASRLAAIKKLIFDNMPAGNYHSVDDIMIEFPQTVAKPETISFDKVANTKITYLGAYENGVQGSNYFELEFAAVNIGDGSAGIIASIIKGQMGQATMVSSISFQVDTASGIAPTAAIDLSLTNVTGNGLLMQQNPADNNVYLLNNTFYDIALSAVAAGSTTNLSPVLLVPNNSSVLSNASVPAPAPVTADNYQSALPVYVYRPVPDYIKNVLGEIRFDVQKNVNDSIVITNNTGLFTVYSIKQIDIALYIVPAGETDLTKSIKNENTSIVKDGAIYYLGYTLPVGQYTSKWSIVYATTIAFTDGRPNQVNNIQVIEDLNSIGKVINLTVSNLNLVH